MQSATAYLLKLDTVLTLIFQHKSFNTLNNNWLHQETDERSDISRQRWVITASQRRGGTLPSHTSWWEHEKKSPADGKHQDESAQCMMGKQSRNTCAAAGVYVYT